ncbi:MAG: hypothetical protein DMD29_08270 [Gemmatimonadetes bacterium]|nr:MAG: hypothetical protein DMD29_08270 [Gemmatimonadota bacterium]
MIRASRLVAVGSLLALTVISCDQPTTSPIRLQADATASSVSFFTDRASFLAQFPGLALADFETGQVLDGRVKTCRGPVDATTNDDCFHPGEIPPGVQFNADHFEAGEELVLVGTGFFGAPSKNLVANVFTDAFLIDFSGGNVTAVGMDLVAYLSDDVCQVDVFGQSGLLVSTTAACTAGGTFWGASTSEAITRIRIFSPSGQSEGVDNVVFGQGTRSLPPVANAGGPYTGLEGAAVNFDGSASATNPPGGALTYAWAFGDGATAAGATPSHTYADNGSYTVTLTVTAVDGGLTNSATALATIANVAPTVNPFAGAALHEGETYTADGSFTDPGADTWTATVDYGDGSGPQPLALTGMRFSLSHVFPAGRPGPFTVTVTVRDDDAGVGSAVATVTVQVNRAPIANAGPAASGVEGATVAFDGTHSSDPDGDALSYTWDFGDGSSGTGPTPTHRYADNGSYTVKLTVSDGSLSGEATTRAVITNVAPSVGPITAPIDPLEAGTAVTAGAAFTDPGTLDTHTGVIDWGDGSTSPAAISETNGSGSASGSHAYAAAGVYTLTLTVTDKDGGSGQSVFQFVVVFNPLGGFVTGGGWIISPRGAYPANPLVTGKATFGFVSKYPKNAITPTGNTEFDFHLGSLHFHSTSYDWLVVSTSKVRFKGSGTINGAGDFAFLVSAVDGDVTGGDPDTFRMKIWDKSTGVVIYDSEMGSGDGAPATTVLGGGSIVIHN